MKYFSSEVYIFLNFWLLAKWLIYVTALKNYGGSNPTAALKVVESPDGLPAEATILSADWKTYFGTRSIFTRGRTHLRESAERFTRLRLFWHSTQLSLWSPGYVRACVRATRRSLASRLRNAVRNLVSRHHLWPPTGNIGRFMWRLNYAVVT